MENAIKKLENEQSNQEKLAAKFEAEENYIESLQCLHAMISIEYCIEILKK